MSHFRWFVVDVIGHFFLDFGVEDFWNFYILKFVHVLNSDNTFRVELFELEAKHGWNELFFLEEGSQIRVSHQEQVREIGAEKGSIDIGKFLFGVVNISASWTVNFNSREFTISTHTDWDYVLVFAHDTGTVAKFSCQVSLSHQGHAQRSLNVPCMDEAIQFCGNLVQFQEPFFISSNLLWVFNLHF